MCIDGKRALRGLMQEHSLRYDDVARLCRVSVATVRSWLLSEKTAGRRNVPDGALLLLRLQLEQGKLIEAAFREGARASAPDVGAAVVDLLWEESAARQKLQG